MIDLITIKNEKTILNISKFGVAYNESRLRNGSVNHKFKIYLKELKVFVEENDEGEAYQVSQQYDKHDHALTLTVNSSIGFKIRGSLRKWWYGALSVNADLNYITFCKCIKAIAQKIGLNEKDLWDSRVSAIEIGGNLKLTSNYKNIIANIDSYSNRSRFGDRRYTVYFKVKNNADNIIIYDKIQEVYDNSKNIKRKLINKLLKSIFILRFEIQIEKPYKTKYRAELKTLSSIRDNWEVLIDYWYGTFSKIELTHRDPPKLPVGKKNFTRNDYKNYFIQLGMLSYGGSEMVDILISETANRTKIADEKKHFRGIANASISDKTLNFFSGLITAIEGKADQMKKGVS